MEGRQKFKVAIVTGAGGMRAIGRGIALRFARDGLDVALVDVRRDAAQIPPAEVAAGWKGIESVQAEVEALGRRAIAIYADISDPAQVQEACERTTRELGPIDVLVNNARAGIGRDRAPVVELDPAEWDRVMAVNMRGTFLMTQAAARRMVQRGGPGRIINMSSTAGKRGHANHAAYSASKFGIIGMTQALAEELAPYGITANAICPGSVDTGRFSLAEQKFAEKEGITLEEASRRTQAERARSIPLGRTATADDIAGMAAFLISEDAGHVTGQAINVCGGVVFH